MSASFEGYENIKRKLNNLLLAKHDALKAAGVSILLSSQKSIINQGYGQWAPWKRDYGKWQMEWKTGTMLRSLALGDSGNVFQEDENSITVGSNVAYTAAQNLGLPSHNLPPRPFLFFDEQRLQLAKDAYLNQIKLAWSKG